jgi:hypothetical protein
MKSNAFDTLDKVMVKWTNDFKEAFNEGVNNLLKECPKVKSFSLELESEYNDSGYDWVSRVSVDMVPGYENEEVETKNWRGDKIKVDVEEYYKEHIDYVLPNANYIAVFLDEWYSNTFDNPYALEPKDVA